MLLELDTATKHHGSRAIMSDASGKVAKGEIVLVTGESGVGKTTLLRLIGLLDAPTRGRIVIDDADAGRLNESGRARLRLLKIGHVFQSHNMMDDLSIRENVRLPMALARRADEPRVDALLARFGLTHRAHARPREVSGGERQRAAFARALANAPDLILADEPTASLDDENAARVIDTLLELQEHGHGVVVATHDTRIVRALRGRAAHWTLRDGTLIEEGAPMRRPELIAGG